MMLFRQSLPTFALMSLVACSPGRMSLSGKCNPVGTNLHNGDSIPRLVQGSEMLSLVSDSTVESPLGGVLLFELIEQQDKEAVASVASAPFSALRFKNLSACSVHTDSVAVTGKTVSLNINVSFDCFGRLFYRGSNPRLQLYMKGKVGQGNGYVTIPVDYPQINARNVLLKTLENVPGLDITVRTTVLQNLFFPEVILNTRTALSGTPVVEPDPETLEALCLKVSEEEIAFYEGQDDPQGIHPLQSSEPRPVNCQMLLQGLKHRVTVAAEFAQAESEVLDKIKKMSTGHHDQAKLLLGDKMELISRLENAHVEREKADQRLGIAQLGMLLIRSAKGGCHSEDESVTKTNQTFAQFREALKPIIEERLPQDLREPFINAFDHNCNLEQESFLVYDDKFMEAYDQSDLNNSKFAKALNLVQKSMKANPALLGVATNHIRTIDTDSFSVEYEDLPIFVGKNPIAPELALTRFTFDNPWISMTFDVTKAHPQLNNLRTAYNDGYSITFGGLSVGSVAAKVEQSGGAAVTPLPAPQPADHHGRDPFMSEMNKKSASGASELKDLESNQSDNKVESGGAKTKEANPDDC